MSNQSTYVKALEEQNKQDPGEVPVVSEPCGATINQNVVRNLAALGIQGVEVFESRPDRLFAWDLERQLLVACAIHREHWMLDRWDPLHGGSTRESFREKARPSMQCCFHACINETNGEPYFVEIDFDEAPPSNPVTILIHGKEVLVNALTGDLTDQDKIAAGLSARYQKENDSGKSA